ncbi:MAG: DUF4175 family protein [Bacteroidota bacterium]|nr:DUF4175 family protein [Bacteroidota bacterium]
MRNHDFDILISKLDAFIKRYYVTQMLRGVFITAAIVGTYYLAIALLEYVGHFSVSARTVIFYLSLALIAGVFIWFIVRPLLGFLKIGKRISYKQASQILRQHFPVIQDKLENSLELFDMAKATDKSKDLVLASVAQKTSELKPLPFLSALPLKKSLVFAKYLVPSLILLLLALFFWPSALSEGTQRIVRYKEHFVLPPPFVFELKNDSLQTKKGNDLEIKVTTKGKNIPEKVWIHFSGNHLMMQKKKANLFTYKFKSINNSMSFHLEAADVISDQYNIEVLPTPVLTEFRIKTEPPAYTGESVQELKNQGDINMPAGSAVQWYFNTRETEKLCIVFSNTSVLEAVSNNAIFSADTTLIRSTAYRISMANEYFKNDNQLRYNIHVIPDMYPDIKVRQKRDSSDLNLFYFNGVISDDYGFKSLNFMYNAYDNPDSLTQIPVQFNKNLSPQEFYFAWDFSQFNNQDVDAITYFFEVGDNDAINGSKTSRSQIQEFRFPDSDELNKVNEETNQAIENKIDEARKLSQSLRKDMKDLQRKLIDKNMSSWERQQVMENIEKKQQSLENLMQQINKQNQERNQMMESYGSQKESIREKQKQIEELLENLMDEEMREMLEKLKELMKNNETEEMHQLMQEMEMSYEDLDKQLDNNLEMLKQMEVEERVQNTIDELNKLSEEHKKLSEKTKQKPENTDQIKQEQKSHEEEMKSIQEDYEKTMKKNEDLKEPMNMDDFKEEFEDIKKSMEETDEMLEKNKPNKASEQQEKSSEKMKEMSENLMSMMEQNMQAQAGENIEDLKQLLHNLVQFSFDQEKLIEKFLNINSRDPRFKDIIIEQGKLQRSFDIINDSLTALSSRVPQIGNIVRGEQKNIRNELEKIMTNIDNNRLHKVRTSQQMVMTHANNVALLLSEALDQMQQQMNSMGSCSGSCKKPGQGKPKMGEMRKRQQNLKKQLQEMLDMMKQGQKPGGKNGQKQMSKQISKMLAEQEIMQKMLNDIMSEQNIHPDAAKRLREINQMLEESKNELINRNITPDLLKRQEQIVTRMLEAERSEFEREIDKERKSEEAKHYKISNPEEAFQKALEKESFNELLEFSRLKMTRFYKEKYKEYLLKINQ